MVSFQQLLSNHQFIFLSKIRLTLRAEGLNPVECLRAERVGDPQNELFNNLDVLWSSNDSWSSKGFPLEC